MHVVEATRTQVLDVEEHWGSTLGPLRRKDTLACDAIREFAHDVAFCVALEEDARCSARDPADDWANLAK